MENLTEFCRNIFSKNNEIVFSQKVYGNLLFTFDPNIKQSTLRNLSFVMSVKQTN